MKNKLHKVKLPEIYSKTYKELMLSCLQLESEKRPTMKDVLNNPLFHKNAMYDMIQGIEDLSVRKRDSKLYKKNEQTMAIEENKR